MDCVFLPTRGIVQSHDTVIDTASSHLASSLSGELSAGRLLCPGGTSFSSKISPAPQSTPSAEAVHQDGHMADFREYNSTSPLL